MTSGDPARELAAAREACGLADRSDLGRLRSTGRDILDLLHRLSTADLRGLPVGQGRPTVLTTGKGRIVARLFVHRVEESAVYLCAGSGEAAAVRAHLDRFTFAEDTGLSDETARTCQLVLVGPRAGEAFSAGGHPLPGPFESALATIGGCEAWVLGQDGWSAEGVSVLGRLEDREALATALVKLVVGVGGSSIGGEALEAWRVLRGHPSSGRELTQERNPLEAGLWDAVSFAKGCYVGQEVVARLRTYDRVSRSLRGIMFTTVPDPRTDRTLFLDGREVGEITSLVVPPGAAFAVALAFVKRSAVPGAFVRVGGAESPAEGRIVELPFDPVP